jgi:hypothetical protein
LSRAQKLSARTGCVRSSPQVSGRFAGIQAYTGYCVAGMASWSSIHAVAPIAITRCSWASVGPKLAWRSRRTASLDTSALESGEHIATPSCA